MKNRSLFQSEDALIDSIIPTKHSSTIGKPNKRLSTHCTTILHHWLNNRVLLRPPILPNPPPDIRLFSLTQPVKTRHHPLLQDLPLQTAQAWRRHSTHIQTRLETPKNFTKTTRSPTFRPRAAICNLPRHTTSSICSWRGGHYVPSRYACGAAIDCKSWEWRRCVGGRREMEGQRRLGICEGGGKRCEFWCRELSYGVDMRATRYPTAETHRECGSWKAKVSNGSREAVNHNKTTTISTTRDLSALT